MTHTDAVPETTSDTGPAAPLRVAYILHRFPHLTETFIVREMHWLQDHNIDLTIFSLMAPKSVVRSRQAEDLLALGRYSPAFSWDVMRSQLFYLARSPLRYMRALARVAWQTYREPKVMLLALALFPKSVRFARDMEELGIDHIHAHFAWIEGISAGVAKDLNGTTFTIHPHAFGLFTRNRRDVRRELENATQVVTISEYHRRYIADLAPGVAADHIRVVHCGIEPDRIQPPAERTREGPLRILAVGRAVEKKGHEYLIEACGQLRKQRGDFQCDLVVGAGGRRQQLEALVDRFELRDCVNLFDARDEDGIFQLLAQADIFALPCVVAESGDRDGVPVSLMEAMASELPVISTPVTGIPELIDDGENGFLVPPRDAPALAAALETLLDDAELRARLGAAGRAKVLKEFDVRDSAATMATIFRSVSGGRR